MPSAPPDAATARFRKDVLTRLGTGDAGRIGLAVSGGPDSLALLLLAKAAFPDVEAATVDHGLRAESGAEAKMVSNLCVSLAVPHETLVLNTKPDGNLSDWARRERYAALADWVKRRDIALLMTAHHADDQLETLIMRLNRGAGLAGLSGIRGKTGNVVRPLLGWRKTELEALVRACHIEPVDDPSNRDDRFDRARLRKMLAQADWLDPVAATRSAEALAQAEEALDWTARAYAARKIARAGDVVSLAPDGLPHALLRRLVLVAMREIVPGADPRGDELERLIQGLQAGRVATLAGVKCTGGPFWLFTLAPPHRKN